MEPSLRARDDFGTSRLSWCRCQLRGGKDCCKKKPLQPLQPTKI